MTVKKKLKKMIKRECKDSDNGCLSGIYRRGFDLAESAEPEEIDRA